MPALANAVHDAVGVRVDEIPVTPEKVRKAEEYFRSATDDRRAKKPSAALLNVKLAISYDPLCESYHEFLDELEAQQQP